MQGPTDAQEEQDPMIITAATGMPQSEMDVWATVRSYLNLQVPLAAVLRRPYSFLRQGGDESLPAAPVTNVLKFRHPSPTAEQTQEDQGQR